MTETADIENFTRDLPDSAGAKRFFKQLQERNSSEAKKLLKNSALLSDVLTIAAYSPLLGTTLLQNPSYFNWLKRRRSEGDIRGKEELLESLARFALTNSEIEPQILLARFRRRELLRIYLRDIRRLGTIAEITREISVLADAVLEYALRLARQEQDNRYGQPQEIDEKGRAKSVDFCIVSLGKLGSEELNYSSDIDLLFLYSADGTTSGNGSRGSVTNREYFTKLAESVTKIVGQQTGEGAAYRVDLRLRPHGRVGALAVSLKEAVKYYKQNAQSWERQTLIRARISAGDTELFKKFYAQVSSEIYSTEETVENALRNVKLSKEKINSEHGGGAGFNVKLGRGGIREIEFIAQALQSAYGGNDVWLRVSHTLKSLSRLADRRLIGENDLTELSAAYGFLRRLEHHLQMENGLQTHIVPQDEEKKLLAARKMSFKNTADFDTQLSLHIENVSRIFYRIFGSDTDAENYSVEQEITPTQAIVEIANSAPSPIEKSKTSEIFNRVLLSSEKSGFKIKLSRKNLKRLETFCEISPAFAEMLAAAPNLIKDLPNTEENLQAEEFEKILMSAVEKQADFSGKLSALRKNWSKFLLEIAYRHVFEKIDWRESKKLQTRLAEASLHTAFYITQTEAEKRFGYKNKLEFAVLGLGKLGGGGMDYGSDLDLTLICDDKDFHPVNNFSEAEFYARIAEIFVAVLSNFTRDGNLYRVDLRLRPDGKNGATVASQKGFLNYLSQRSAIWEWLAYVKLRGVTGDINLALQTEKEARAVIHQNALNCNPEELKTESLRIRERLAVERVKNSKEIDIKFGQGGMIDVYFAARYLQLRDNIPDDEKNRSTLFTVEKLREVKAIGDETFEAFYAGYSFLAQLDHNLRLTVGRSNYIPLAKPAILNTVMRRMNFENSSELLNELNLHRLNIRNSFEEIFR